MLFETKHIEKLHLCKRITHWMGLVITTIIISCKPFLKIERTNTNIVTSTKDGLTKIKGTYSNSFDTTFGKIIHRPYDGINDKERLTILDQLFLNYPQSTWRNETGNLINPQNKWIKIEFTSHKKATISMYNNDNFIFSKTIHGKLKKGYFYQRPKVLVIPFFPLMFGYCFQRTRIGKTTDENLVIDYRVNKWGFVLFAGSSDKGAVSTIYRKKTLK